MGILSIKERSRNIVNSVGSRLLAIMLSIIIVGMGLIALIGGILSSNSFAEQSLGRISATTSLSVSEIELWILEQSGYVASLANSLSLVDTANENLKPILQYHANSNESYNLVFVGFPNGRGIFSADWTPDYNVWSATERSWYKGAMANPEQVFVTDLYVDSRTGEPCITFSKVFRQNGAIAGVVGVDLFTDVLGEVVHKTDVGEQSYAFLTFSNGDIIKHSLNLYLPTLDADGSTAFENIGTIEGGAYSALRSESVLSGAGIKMVSADGIARYYTASTISRTGWVFYTAIPVNVVDAPIIRQTITMIVILAAVALLAAFLTFYAIRRLIIRPVKDVTDAANLLARGEKGASLDGYYVGEIALLADSFRGMESFNEQQTAWMQSIADGDLSIDVVPRSDGDSIGQSIISMLANLNALFADINASSRQVSTGSRQIAEGAQTLAYGTTEQSAAIEQLSVTLVDISENAERNAEIASEAAKLSNVIRGNAEKGSLQMDQLMEAVQEIDEASNSIRNVIKTIDDIAFQTNILALNAAVEAARAGEHGRGFAVVADEVRNLAAKSAEAAKTTEELIQNSIEKANLGLTIATETADSLAGIVEGINRSSEIVDQIAVASGKQNESILYINSGIDQVSQVVQQNSSTAEESAAASEEMSNQSSSLEMLISYFKLRELN